MHTANMVSCHMPNSNSPMVLKLYSIVKQRNPIDAVLERLSLIIPKQYFRQRYRVIISEQKEENRTFEGGSVLWA